MTTRSNLGIDWITTKGLPSGYYQNGLEIGSSVYLKATQTVLPTPTGFLTAIPTGSVGLFACKWVNNNYTGPILKLRNASTTQDFYIDKTGTAIGMAIGGTGTSLTTWLSGATAYVETWYDQSLQATPKHANQTNTTLQPTYDITSKSINFTTSSYLIIDSTNSTLLSDGKVPFTLVYQSALSANLSSASYPTIFTTGLQNSNNNALYSTISNINLANTFYGNNLVYNRTPTNNEVVTYSYDGTTRRIYLNNNLMTSDTPTAMNLINTGGKSYIGFFEGGANKFTGNISFLFLNNTLLSDANRQIMEGIGGNMVRGGTFNQPVAGGLQQVTTTSYINNWTASTPDTTNCVFLIAVTGSVYAYGTQTTSPYVPVLGSGITQYLISKNVNPNFPQTITQPITISTAGTYTFSFYYAGRNSSSYTTNHKLSVNLGSQNLVLNLQASPLGWQLYTVNVTLTTGDIGINNLVFTFVNSVAFDSSYYVSGISLIQIS